MIPAFKFQGGKARIAKECVSLFPMCGNRYIELFVGKGNIFFQARNDLSFNSWELYDRDTSFLKALRSVDLFDLPTVVGKRDFEFWANDDSDVAKVIESDISFCGKGYAAGYGTDRYIRSRLQAKCERAKVLLGGCLIMNRLWDSFDFDSLIAEDFLYLDPPYYRTSGPYPNIDHFALCKKLNQVKCRWALSGYDNPIYNEYLTFKNRLQIQRNSEIKGRSTRTKQEVTEVILTSY